MIKQNVFIFAILVTSASSSGLVFAESEDHPKKEVEPVALVRTQLPVKKALMDTLTVYGSIQNPPQAIYNVNLSQAGQITAIYVSSGQYVRKGQALLTIKTDPQLIMNTTQAQSAVVFAQGERQRVASLVNARLATQSQLATAEKALTDAKAALNALQQQGGARKTQTIHATADAQVNSMNNQVGDHVAAATTIMQLGKTATPQAVIGIAPDMLNRLRVGMPVTISPALATGQTESLQGSILRIDGAINPQTGRVDIPVQLKHSLSGRWRIGVPVKAILQLNSLQQKGQNGWVVPRNTVLQDQQGHYIYQVNKNHAVRVPVQLGVQTNKESMIYGQVNPNFKIVTLGNYTLKNGMRVQEQTR